MSYIRTVLLYISISSLFCNVVPLTLPKPPLPFPSTYSVYDKASAYLSYRRTLIDEGFITADSNSNGDNEEEEGDSLPTTKSAGSTTNPLIISLSLRPSPLTVPSITSSYYLSRDVLDYGEMTTLGFDDLVRDVMKVEGGRMKVYKELGITPPSKPKEVKGEGRELELREEGWSSYGGLKLGEALEDDLELASKPNETRNPGSLPYKPKILPDTRNPENVPTPMWTSDRLDERGRVEGRAVSWAREMREKRIKEGGRGGRDGAFEIGGVKVHNGNQMWMAGWVVWVCLAKGQVEGSWGNYVGDDIGRGLEIGLKAFGFIGTLGWIGVGAKQLLDGKGIVKALIGPDFKSNKCVNK